MNKKVLYGFVIILIAGGAIATVVISKNNEKDLTKEITDKTEVITNDNDKKTKNDIKLYNWEIPVKINFPEGEDIEEKIVEEYDESYVDYCHSAYGFIEKALQMNNVDFEFSKESGYFTQIAGLDKNKNHKWKLYLNGQKSPYKINEHCMEEDWKIELIYE